MHIVRGINAWTHSQKWLWHATRRNIWKSFLWEFAMKYANGMTVIQIGVLDISWREVVLKSKNQLQKHTLRFVCHEEKANNYRVVCGTQKRKRVCLDNFLLILKLVPTTVFRSTTKHRGCPRTTSPPSVIAFPIQLLHTESIMVLHVSHSAHKVI